MVISDSHGHIPALTTVLNWAQNTDLTAAVFLGDGADDLPAASANAGFTIPWSKVRGNGDLNLSIKDYQLLEIPVPGGMSRKLFLSHGNHFYLDDDGQTIAEAARNAGAEAALFGHTHIPHCSVLDGIFLLNPGSIGRSRISAGPTFAVMECPQNGPLTARFYVLVHHGRNLAVQELELK